MSRAQLRAGLIGSRDGQTLPCMGRQVGSTAVAGVSVTPGASNTPGAWTELITASAADAHYVTLNFINTYVSAQAVPMLADLAIGAAGSEVAIVSSIACGQMNGVTVVLPLFVTAGSRIAIRLTTAYASPSAATIRCELDDRADRSGRRNPSKLVTMGATVGSSTGVAITSNDTWVEIISATTEPYQGLMFSVTGNDASVTSSNGVFSLGVGTSGAEQVIDTVPVSWNALEYYAAYTGGFYPVSGTFPKGTRIAAKTSTGVNNNIGVVVLGVPYT